MLPKLILYCDPVKNRYCYKFWHTFHIVVTDWKLLASKSLKRFMGSALKLHFWKFVSYTYYSAVLFYWKDYIATEKNIAARGPCSQYFIFFIILWPRPNKFVFVRWQASPVFCLLGRFISCGENDVNKAKLHFLCNLRMFQIS